MTRFLLLACLAGAAVVVAATYLHLERAMRREPEPWVEPYDGEAIGV